MASGNFVSLGIVLSPCIVIRMYVTCLVISLMPTSSHADWSHGFTSFLSPQWGGLVVYNHNLSGSDNTQLSVDVHHVMPTFITQLKKLFGLPELVIM